MYNEKKNAFCFQPQSRKRKNQDASAGPVSYTHLKVFGESHIDEIAAELKVPVLGKMPIDVKLAELADSGLFSKIENEYITAAADVMPKAEA